MAILLNTLMPPLAHAAANAAPRNAAVWEEICSAHGTANVADAAADPADDSSGHAPAVAHCPFCTPHGEYSVLPTATMPPLLPKPAAVFLPPRSQHAPPPLFAWASAPPRAPPAAS